MEHLVADRSEVKIIFHILPHPQPKDKLFHKHLKNDIIRRRVVYLLQLIKTFPPCRSKTFMATCVSGMQSGSTKKALTLALTDGRLRLWFLLSFVADNANYFWLLLMKVSILGGERADWTRVLLESWCCWKSEVVLAVAGLVETVVAVPGPHQQLSHPRTSQTQHS